MATNKNDVSIALIICEYLLYAFIIGVAVFMIVYGSIYEPPKDALTITGGAVLSATLTKMGISVSKQLKKEKEHE